MICYFKDTCSCCSDSVLPDSEIGVRCGGADADVAASFYPKVSVYASNCLSNEKFRGIRVTLDRGQLQLSANNPEQEEAEETMSVEYDGDGLEVGFNASYLQDVLAVLENDRVRVTLHDGNSSAVLEDPELEDAIYVVMPMKL